MKGVINRSIQELVETMFDGETWEKVKRSAGCEESFFAISLDYPDEMTVSLIEAVSGVTGLNSETVMVELGKFIVTHSLKKYYPAYPALSGSTPREFIGNVNRIHQEMTRSLNNAALPGIECVDLPNGRLQVSYSSDRRLCVVMRGLLQGVGILFGQELTVKETACMQQGSPRCTMEVSFP